MSCFSKKFKKSPWGHLGEKVTSKEGKEMRVAEDYGNGNILAMYKEDNSTQKGPYNDFKDGLFVKKKVYGNVVEGNEYHDSNGNIVIVTSIEGDTASVSYMDGDTLTGIPLHLLEEGNFNKSEASPYIGKTDDEKNMTLALERSRAEMDVIWHLNKYRRCILVRPCGWGKTWLGLKLIASGKYGRALFLYPNASARDFVKVKEIQKKRHLDVQTYRWLIDKVSNAKEIDGKKDLSSLKYDFIFLDEVDCTGGEEKGRLEDGTIKTAGAFLTFKSVKALLDANPGAHVLGATATPYRMDGINVVSKLFYNHACYPYTLLDALNDGLLIPPKYFIVKNDIVVRDAKNSAKIIKEESLTKKELKKNWGLSDKQINSVHAKLMHDNIRQICDNNVEDTSYMKWIVYYHTHETLYKNMEKVLEWFRKAYPGHEVVATVVLQGSDADLKTVDNLPTKPSNPEYKGRIDVVFNCQILCRGYHSETVTGLILDRELRSFKLYEQIIGRVMTLGNKKSGIIIDIPGQLKSLEDIPPIRLNDILKSEKIELPPEPVIINKKPQTYEELAKRYPGAVDWDKINKHVEHAGKSEAYVKDLMNAMSEDDEDIADSDIFGTETSVFEPSDVSSSEHEEQAETSSIDMSEKTAPQEKSKPAKKLSLRERARKIADEIKNKGLSFVQAGELAQKYLNEYEENGGDTSKNLDVNDISAGILESREENEKPERKKRSTSKQSERTSSRAPRKQNKHELPVVEEDDSDIDEAFNVNVYYRNPDGSQLWRIMKLGNEESDLEDLYEHLDGAEELRLLKKVLDEINNKVSHGFTSLRPYTSLDQVDKRSPEYLAIANISKNAGLPIDRCIKLMIENCSDEQESA